MHAETLKAKLMRCWPAIVWAGVQLGVALVGLPLRPDAPFHHWLLAYVVVGTVIATTVVCGVRGGSKACTALLSFAVSIAVVLNVCAFNTLLASDDAGLDFLSGLIGVQPQTIRSALVLLFAIFATLLTTTWRHVLGVSSGLRVTPDGQGMVSNAVASGSATLAGAGRGHRPKREDSSRPANPPENMAHPAGEQGRAPDEPRAGEQSNGRRQTSTHDVLALCARGGDRWGASHVALSALPLLVFLLVCILAVGGSETHLATDQARLGSATEQVPAAPTTIPPPVRIDAERPPPNAQSSSAGPDRSKRGRGRRPEVGARAPP